MYVICYNFMPILDWTRTRLDMPLEDGSLALEFNASELRVLISIFSIEKGPKKTIPRMKLNKPKINLQTSHPQRFNEYLTTCSKAYLALEEGYSMDEFKAMLDTYKGIDANQLRFHLIQFLKEIIPLAEELGIRMCIHPDDPPFTLLGLPRVVSTQADYQYIFDQVPPISNGITFARVHWG